MRAAAVLAALLCAGTAAAAPPEAVYEVRPGQTLWIIAGDLFGDPYLWPLLYRANRDQIKDPSLLYPGQKLTVPQVDPADRRALRGETGEPGTR